MSIAGTPSSVKLITVIEVKAARGEGTDADPVRIVNQYWSTEGDLLAEDDPIDKYIVKEREES